MQDAGIQGYNWRPNASQVRGCTMRIVLGALLLGAGLPVFCQSVGTAAASPGEPGQTPPTVFLLSPKEFDKAPPLWHITPESLLKMNVPSGLGPLRKFSELIDPQMVVHPPQGSVGVQPPGTQVAQNLYPGLHLMPIEQLKLKGEPIPITFPNAKVEKIPTTWPGYKITAIQTGTSQPAAK